MAEERVDHLEQDVYSVPGQTYALVSFVSPTSNQKNAQCGMKIRGVFGTREEAETYVKRLQKTDPLFDVFLCEMYKWICVPPNVEEIEDVRYQEDYLQDLVSGYKKNQEEAKMKFGERKDRVLKEGLETIEYPDSAPTLESLESTTLPPARPSSDGASSSSSKV